LTAYANRRASSVVATLYRSASSFALAISTNHFICAQRCHCCAGKKYPKAKHRFTLNDALFMAIVGIWKEGQCDKPPPFAMLTTEPGEDTEPYHNRQIVC
jgi:hypothetical protein